MARHEGKQLSKQLPDTLTFKNKLQQPDASWIRPVSLLPHSKEMLGHATGHTTVPLPDYEVYNNDIRIIVQEGTVFQSQTFLYATTKNITPQDATRRPPSRMLSLDMEPTAASVGLFEVVQVQTG